MFGTVSPQRLVSVWVSGCAAFPLGTDALGSTSTPSLLGLWPTWMGDCGKESPEQDFGLQNGPDRLLPAFRCGDEIMEIDGTVVYNMALNDVYTVLSQVTTGPVHIIVSRHPDPKVSKVFFNGFKFVASLALLMGSVTPPPFTSDLSRNNQLDRRLACV